MASSYLSVSSSPSSRGLVEEGIGINRRRRRGGKKKKKRSEGKKKEKKYVTIVGFDSTAVSS